MENLKQWHQSSSERQVETTKTGLNETCLIDMVIDTLSCQVTKWTNGELADYAHRHIKVFVSNQILIADILNANPFHYQKGLSPIFICERITLRTRKTDPLLIYKKDFLYLWVTQQNLDSFRGRKKKLSNENSEFNSEEEN